ncbi:TspO protein [Candidatus Woesearchaeota archaeon CG10_big_fil_rev_8_21_14_0_10_34_12]|nr:MAG: TspO protein [Candidatus Woesearchaeota archaeon CG10_big_fil_rev_8_21_14_0_10_34_12]
MKKRNLGILLACFAIVVIVATIGSIFTSKNVDSSWYESIKPSITPPNYVFPVAWTILFFLIALSLYYSWINAKKKQKNKIAIVFGINFIFNISWSILYFGLKNPAASFFELIVLWLSITAMMHTTYKIDKKAAYLLIPYLLWVTFAGVLNYLSAFT